MKLQFVSYDNIDIIKSNLKSWVDNFKQDSSDWLQDELGNALFSDTKFAEIPDFSLDMSADKPFLTEAENVKRIYGNLRFLSDSQASDERLWAGLCLGPFWDYVKYRWDILFYKSVVHADYRSVLTICIREPLTWRTANNNINRSNGILQFGIVYCSHIRIQPGQLKIPLVGFSGIQIVFCGSHYFYLSCLLKAQT